MPTPVVPGSEPSPAPGARRPLKAPNAPAEPEEHPPIDEEEGEEEGQFLSAPHDAPGQRVAVLVDIQDMYHAAKRLHSRPLAYAKVLDAVVRDRTLIRAVAYVIDRDGVDQQGFVDHLRHSGFLVRRKPIYERPDGFRKASWEVGIAVEALQCAAKCDVIVLVTGDPDFSPLVEEITTRGALCEIACFPEVAAHPLLAKADFVNVLGREHLY
ncbi:MAG: NYN domain-containing protein [Planctomycetes bacterium]|nr:NYN domain-containing protein [Planctomycetota bacterium]